ncbi:MAG: 4-(cytidine 5'-diphospho)-2-C-methyl-D-erythritol kinase [Lachnospiraceae bacterium]|nr:4-(cytidine 5'-diphospho)-2-C-methyl-D-erythritol kinase [Lachnospiraceae bacterium]
MNEISLKAYAKINLALDVIGEREDGYHELRSVMQTVGVHDVLKMSLGGESGTRIVCDDPSLPTGEDNIIFKAIEQFRREFGVTEGVEVRLEKRIPVAAGLGGGSSDAAAALKGMDALFGTGLDTERLCEIGVKVGADVPFCLMGGTALAEGVGEKLTSLAPAQVMPVILVKPPFSVSTAQVYKALEIGGLSHPDVDGMILAIEKGDVRGVAELVGNVLETVTLKLHPEIAAIKRELLDEDACAALMSGSGPTVFGLFEDSAAAEKVYEKIRSMRPDSRVLLTRFEG